ncbi:halocyanin domain-containing protein [Natrinema salinisoli]|uniref:halocyanin domain-containing protein n=1 Tax=Natrinema salinisoli TaxID=2878535 RepID=UPI001CF0BDB2|nr:halocyanin domain-containing protein [Natrinema salinisoli]
MNKGLPDPSLRVVIHVFGATVIGASFAGCLGSPSENSDESRRADETYVDDPPDYVGWFDDIDNYRWTVDERGQDEVFVRVGARSRGMASDPPAVMIALGTTIVWEWAGDGGTHNVVAESGEFESEYSNSSDYAYEYTFEDSGVFKYVCEPHGQRE